ncbi:MAG: uroporphyrinogen decarboxylase family protein [Anaerolineae bacterium]
MDHLQRFLGVMEYQHPDRVPNWELGVWPQTVERWATEGLDPLTLHWDWFAGEETLGMDPREFIRFNGSLLPPMEEKTLAEDERTITFRDGMGRVRRALKEGTVQGVRMSMDTYISFPVANMQDWEALKPRLRLSPARYEPGWRAVRTQAWRSRRWPLVFGSNCSTLGFYWFCRDLMGTEGLSYAFHDQPSLVHDIVEFHADFLIEAARPILQETTVEYINLNEDMAMKAGPLLSPACYRTFIFPRMRRVVDFFKSHGVRYVAVDSDGNPDPLIPLLMDAGVDVIWPLERAAGQDPVQLRRKYGRSLRLWGGVDKRILAEGPAAIDEHLRLLQPLIEEGGFIPSVDHTVPPDVSWPNFQYYMRSKARLLRGE